MGQAQAAPIASKERPNRIRAARIPFLGCGRCRDNYSNLAGQGGPKTTDFGAFVSVLPGRDGLVHISKLGRKQTPKRTYDARFMQDDIGFMAR
jgi:hypothetical protein